MCSKPSVFNDLGVSAVSLRIRFLKHFRALRGPQEGPKSAPRAPKIAPRRTQDRPKSALQGPPATISSAPGLRALIYDPPSSNRDRPKSTQYGPSSFQNGSQQRPKRPPKPLQNTRLICVTFGLAGRREAQIISVPDTTRFYVAFFDSSAETVTCYIFWWQAIEAMGSGGFQRRVRRARICAG